MVKYDLTTAWQEIYNTVDNDRTVLFSACVGSATRAGVYLSLGRNKQEDVLLCLNATSALFLEIHAGTPVYAKTTSGTARIVVYRQ